MDSPWVGIKDQPLQARLCAGLLLTHRHELMTDIGTGRGVRTETEPVRALPTGPEGPELASRLSVTKLRDNLAVERVPAFFSAPFAFRGRRRRSARCGLEGSMYCQAREAVVDVRLGVFRSRTHDCAQRSDRANQ